MKKIYVAPSMELIENDLTCSLLAGSLGSGSLPDVDFDDAVGASDMDAEVRELMLEW